MSAIEGFLSELAGLVIGKNIQAANTGAVNGDGFDFEANGGCDGVLIVALYGTAAANNLLKAQVSADDGSADDYGDLADSEVAAGGGSNELQYVDVKRPRKRWIRGVAARGTSTTVALLYIPYRHRTLPVSNSLDGTIAGVRLNHPAEGTA